MQANPISVEATASTPATRLARGGHMLTMFAILLPMILGVLGLVIDYGMLRAKYRIAQHVADAAATAAASDLAAGQPNTVANATAVNYVNNYNGLSAAAVTVQIPPTDGPYAGQAGFVEVQVALPVSTFIMQAIGGTGSYTVRTTSVAGSKAATAGAAVVVLDPSPPGITLPTVVGITLPTTPSLSLGGLEVLGVGQLRVNGAVLVDTVWSGVDQNGDPAGESSGFRSAVTCMPVLQLTTLASLDLRVTGGVDNPDNYVNYQSGQSSPLQANRAPVPDPLSGLPVPTLSADSVNVSTTLQGSANVVGVPLIGPTTTLQPGVYEYIQILTGTVVMNSGVYIIRNRNPITGIALEILGTQVTANGVMFYITSSSGYTPSTGLPDSAATGTPPPLPLSDVAPSVVINAGLLGSQITPLSGTGSVYDGILLFQNRADRRIMIISRDTLLGSGSFSGTVYSQWGHVIFAGMGTLDARFVVGSMRFANIFDVTLQPSQLLPAAKDVFLVQ